MHQDTHLNIHRYHKLMCLNLSSPFLSNILPFHGSLFRLWHLHLLEAHARNLHLPLFPHNAHSICCQFCCFAPFQIQFLHNIHTDQRSCTFRPYNFPWVSARDKADKPFTFPPLSFPTYLHLTYIEGLLFHLITMFGIEDKDLSFGNCCIPRAYPGIPSIQKVLNQY